MFTCNCAIRANNEQIWKALRRMGRINTQCGYGEWYIPVDRCDYLTCFHGSPGHFVGSFCNPHVDYMCDNITQFLVLSNMRDDTDLMQWFVYDNSSWAGPNFASHFLFQCKHDSIRDEMCLDGMWRDCRRATPEEIIERFK